MAETPEEVAREVLFRMGMRDVDNDADVAVIASALRAQYVAGQLDGLEAAAQIFDGYVSDGEALIAHRDPELDAEEIRHYRNIIRSATADAHRIRELAEQAKAGK